MYRDKPQVLGVLGGEKQTDEVSLTHINIHPESKGSTETVNMNNMNERTRTRKKNKTEHARERKRD